MMLWLLAAAALATDPVLPNPKLTPGVVAITDTVAVCSTKWGKDERHVSMSTKKKVFDEYGIPWSRHSQFEVDHLIPRELGGADDVRNLWPESYAGPCGAHQKDRLENRLHKMVCSGAMPLKQAQREISADWLALYKAVFAAP